MVCICLPRYSLFVLLLLNEPAHTIVHFYNWQCSQSYSTSDPRKPSAAFSNFLHVIFTRHAQLFFFYALFDWIYILFHWHWSTQRRHLAQPMLCTIQGPVPQPSNCCNQAHLRVYHPLQCHIPFPLKVPRALMVLNMHSNKMSACKTFSWRPDLYTQSTSWSPCSQNSALPPAMHVASWADAQP